MTNDARTERVTLPLAAETVTVAKRTKVTATVRLHKRVVADEQVIDEPLAVEDIEIERVPVDRWVDGPVATRQEGDTTIISRLEEVLVVEKRLKVVEEIRITRHRTMQRLQETVTVRREEFDIERFEGDLPPSGDGPA